MCNCTGIPRTRASGLGGEEEEKGSANEGGEVDRGGKGPWLPISHSLPSHLSPPNIELHTRKKDMDHQLRLDFLVFVKDQEFKELRREEEEKKSWQV